MQFVIQDSYEPLRSQQIEEFEREFGIALPPQYRDFLLAHNGGSFADRVSFTNEFTGDQVWIDEFYGLDCGALTNSELRRVISVFQGEPASRSQGRIPNDLIPVASSPGGQICLGVLGESLGSVFWWDMEEPADDPYENTIFCADSFDSFVAGMTAEITLPDETISGTPFAFADLGDIFAIDQAIRHGFELDDRDRDGRTLLHRAAQWRRVALVEYLIECGIEINAKDKGAATALHLTGSPDIVRALLRVGAEVDVLDQDGCTPLLRAVEFCRSHIVHLLLGAGANPLHGALRGANAISLCQDKQFILPMLLRAAGLDMNTAREYDPVAEAIRQFDALHDRDT